ncbi:MAG: alpha/beta fold hydrolase [Pseudomonadota bacterium]
MTDLEHAVGLRETFQRLRKALAGLGLVGRAAQLAVGTTPHREIFRENKTRLLRYDLGAAPSTLPPLVMVPSLINRHYIFDLMPRKSIVEFFACRGVAAYSVDWGAPSDEDRYLSLERYVASYLHRAVRAACRDSGQDRVVLVGYCLGGSLAAAYAALHPERVQAFVALTTPIDFTDNGLLGTWSRSASFDLEALIEATGNVPWALLQSSFTLLRPTLSVSKARGILEKFWDNEFLDGVLALETWGNDNVSFAGQCYRQVIETLYRDNALVRGTLHLGGRLVDLRRITCPVLNVQASFDNIVPLAASHALVEQVGSDDVTEWTVPGGHIGAVVSKKAMAQVWPAVLEWLGAHAYARPADDGASTHTPGR